MANWATVNPVGTPDAPIGSPGSDTPWPPRIPDSSGSARPPSRSGEVNGPGPLKTSAEFSWPVISGSGSTSGSGERDEPATPSGSDVSDETPSGSDDNE